MQIKPCGKTLGDQDGACYNGFLFCFKATGHCDVYNMNEVSTLSPKELTPISGFYLEKIDVIRPHSNCVMFGKEFYAEGDEFPLLYTNVYNNYHKLEEKKLGVTCVYRLERNGLDFKTTLVQVIEIGFTKDSLWVSENVVDTRPYGNFVIDIEGSRYIAFTMRDEERVTRYFTFDLPTFKDGEFDKEYGVNRVVLEKEDIKDWFDCDYHHYVQGATYRDGIVYSVEGFSRSEDNPPALRLIDVSAKKQQAVYYFGDFGMEMEAELIDFVDGVCYYADYAGNLYQLTF